MGDGGNPDRAPFETEVVGDPNSVPIAVGTAGPPSVLFCTELKLMLVLIANGSLCTV